MFSYRALLLGVLMAALLFTTACDKKQDTESQEQNTTEEEDPWKNAPTETDTRSLEQKLLEKKDSMDAIFVTMTQADSQRIANVFFLVKSLKDVKDFSNFTLSAEIKKLAEEADALRYNEHNMGQATHMDAYDAAQSKLIDKLKTLPEAMANFANAQTSANTYDEILKSDGNDLYLRRDYMLLAESFNALLEQHQNEVQRSSDERVKNLQPAPVFVYGDMDSGS